MIRKKKQHLFVKSFIAERTYDAQELALLIKPAKKYSKLLLYFSLSYTDLKEKTPDNKNISANLL